MTKAEKYKLGDLVTYSTMTAGLINGVVTAIGTDWAGVQSVSFRVTTRKNSTYPVGYVEVAIDSPWLYLAKPRSKPKVESPLEVATPTDLERIRGAAESEAERLTHAWRKLPDGPESDAYYAMAESWTRFADSLKGDTDGNV